MVQQLHRILHWVIKPRTIELETRMCGCHDLACKVKQNETLFDLHTKTDKTNKLKIEKKT